MENTANLGLFAHHKIILEYAERIYAPNVLYISVDNNVNLIFFFKILSTLFGWMKPNNRVMLLSLSSKNETTSLYCNEVACWPHNNQILQYRVVYMSIVHSFLGRDGDNNLVSPLTPELPNQTPTTPEAKFLVPDWHRVKIDSGIGLSLVHLLEST